MAVSCYPTVIIGSMGSRLRRLLRTAVGFAAAFAAVGLAAADLYIAIATPTVPSLPRTFAPGSSVGIALGTSASIPGTPRWYHDGQLIPGANALNLTLSNLSAADSGNYVLTVTDGTSVRTSNDVTINVLPLPPSPVDRTFATSFSLSSYGQTIVAEFADHSIVVNLRTGIDSQPTLRLSATGAIDPTFSFPYTAGGVLAAHPDGRMIVANAPYRLKADGSPLPLTLPAGYNTTQPLTAAAVQADGKVLIAQGRQVTRLNTDDSVDATFSYATGLSALHTVTAFKFDASNRIYVTATERDSNPSNYPPSWTVMIRLASTGAQDLGFAAQEPPLRRGGLGLFPFSDGRLLRFASYEGIAYWAMLRDDGTVDPAWSAGASYIVNSYAVDPAHNRLFYVDSSQVLRRVLITPTGLQPDPTFYPGDGQASSLYLSSTGLLYALGYFAKWDGFSTGLIARLRPDDVVTSFPPTAGIGPGDVTPTRGSTVTFTSTVTGDGPYTYQWLALDGQPLPANSTSPTLVIANFGLAHFGRYQLRVTTPTATALSNVTRALLSSSSLPYLANLSGRVQVGTGENLAIAGVAVNIRSGALGLPLLIRGAGPALQPYGVTNFLPNPLLDVFNAASTLIANNDTWGGSASLLDAFNACGAFPFQANSNDAALLPTYGTGTYTIHLRDQANASGVGLLEVYRLPSSNVPGDLTNLSLRARTGPGEQVAIAGFVLTDPQNFDRPARILVRAIGPTLSGYGISQPISDPILTLYDGNGRVVAQNDNWSDSASPADLSAAAQTVGAFALPANSKDAALLLDLPPGSYTAQVTGPANASGVTLIEVYLVR